MKLNVKAIEALSPTPGKTTMHGDGGGLYVKVTSYGGKHFVYRYTYAGRRKEMALGTFPVTTLKQARDRRVQAKRMLDDGKDPGEAKRQAKRDKRQALTVEELVQNYHELYLKPHYEQPDAAKAMLDRDLVRVLGKHLVCDLNAGHINRVFDEMVKRDAKVAANRCLTLTKKMFEWALEREYIDANPAAKKTTKNTGGTEQPKTTHLLFDQIVDVLSVLNALPIAKGRHGVALETVLGLKLILGTGKRPLEVVTWKWEHIDWKTKRWITPKELTKEKHGDHVVFLNEYVLNWLKVLREANATSKYVLPCPTRNPESEQPETHITRHSLSRAVLRLNERGIFKVKFTPHDLRRTFSSRAADLKIGPHIVEKCLDHLMTGSMAVYNLGNYLEEREEAMRIWGEKLQALDSYV
jgi:integrase